VTINKHSFSDFDIRILRTQALTSDELAMVHQLFELSYRQANHSYLEQSFAKLRYLALATLGETAVGFAVGDTVESTLPRLKDPQIVALAGISCIAPDFRRQGLFTYLGGLAVSESGLFRPEARCLVCGRMAHPAGLRVMRRSPTLIPKYGAPLSEWHKEIGLRVADLYGANLDPETFVVIGNGTPIGYPRLEIDVTDEEWLPFEAVDRDRGDSLLCICWTPDAPEGW
jgi:hypothetical protein